ncbi:S41 family peptidase [Photobacterium sp. CCB-ST2H9]|uniref:S41 family peptidase n=1 Tax=Photobacterium sp. CCB-ST2H9 TaxID=2912855 RepID=UPI00200498E5|nr:S41 family peptidase [Photobacterium sp. CCB-ST2H9]UTM59403.1 S41 family peptidase [Photobacterium sp. CCB-ST2H9]
MQKFQMRPFFLSSMLLVTTMLLGCGSDGIAKDAEKLTKPTVDAGRDQVLTLPVNSLTLQGKVKSYLSVYDIRKVSWSLASGPQPVNIIDGDREQATVIDIAMAGTYTFRLWAEDTGGRDNSDLVKIVVTSGAAADREMTVGLHETQRVWSVLENNPVLAERMSQLIPDGDRASRATSQEPGPNEVIAMLGELSMFQVLVHQDGVTSQPYRRPSALSQHLGFQRQAGKDTLPGEEAFPEKAWLNPYSAQTGSKNAYLQAVEHYLLTQSLKSSGGDHPMFYWGETQDNIGVMLVSHLSQQNEADIRQQLDLILAELQHTRALILDLTGNPGGSYLTAQLVAERFFTTEMPVFGFERPGASVNFVTFRPEGPVQYSQPVYLVTNRDTAGAAEILALAVKTQPQVKHFGSVTQGAYAEPSYVALSDSLGLSVPEFWLVDINGNRLDSEGIQPTESSAEFTPAHAFIPAYELVFYGF